LGTVSTFAQSTKSAKKSTKASTKAPKAKKTSAAKKSS
jgi:hypothetical protein